MNNLIKFAFLAPLAACTGEKDRQVDSAEPVPGLFDSGCVEMTEAVVDGEVLSFTGDVGLCVEVLVGEDRAPIDDLELALNAYVGDGIWHMGSWPDFSHESDGRVLFKQEYDFSDNDDPLSTYAPFSLDLVLHGELIEEPSGFLASEYNFICEDTCMLEAL
jgi:hypothetical protein